MALIPTEIFLEETEEIITVYLSRDDHERVKVDSSFLRRVVDDHKNSRQQTNEDPGNDGVHATQAIDDSFVDSNAENDETSVNSLFIWNTPCVLLLLHLYEENTTHFDGGKRHKKIYEDIAKKMKETNPQYDVTWAQCQTKVNGLKRTFKKIIDHNNTSGNDKASWPFYDRMLEIFGRTGWANPKALASEAGPSRSNELRSPENQTNTKRRKPNGELTELLEKRFKEAREEKKMRHEEREQRRKEKEEKKEERFQMLLEQRRQQHEEKMKLMEMLFKNK